MKKALSLLLTVIMIASTVIVAVPATMAAETNTLSAHNVGLKIPYYSGETTVNPWQGAGSQLAHFYDDEGQYINFTDKSDTTKLLQLDGEITEEEWGTPLLDLSSEYAARRGESTSPSAENTYYWNAKTGDYTGGIAMDPADLTYPLQMKIWMAWDEDYLYVAAEVRDPDGKNSGGPIGDKIWNGDTLQIRVDPDGPNSVVDGGEYDPETNKFPWKSSVRGDPTDASSKEIYAGKVANIGIAYSEAEYTGMYDMAPRYDPQETEILLADGTVDRIETTWTGKDMFFDREDAHQNPFGSGYAAVYSKANRGAANRREYLTTYEVAIPWTAVNGSGIYDYDPTTGNYSYTVDYTAPQAGDEFGASIALLNRKSGQENYNSFLTWGSGVCAGQLASSDYVTAGGSNSLLLVADELGSDTYTCAHEFADPTCITPYVCTKCGYKKGYIAGHDYTSVVNAIPTNLTDGSITSVCSVCKDVVETTIPAKEGQVRSTWDGTLQSGGDWSASGGYGYLYWSDYYDAQGNTNSTPSVPLIDPATGAQKNTLGTYNGEKVIELISHMPGTYFDSNDTKFDSYSYKYSIRLTGDAFDASTIGENNKYFPGFYSQVGGSSANNSGVMQYGIHYCVGFFPNEFDGTVGHFRIYKSGFGMGVTDTATLLCESEEIDLGTEWHEIVTMYDDDTDTLLLTCDGELKVGLWDAGLDQNGFEIQALFRRFYTTIMMKDMAFGNITAFFEEEGEPTPPAPTTFTVSCDGEVIGTYSEGDTVTLPAPAFKPASGRNLAQRFYNWTGNGVTVTRSAYSKNNTNSSKRSYTMTMPAANVELTSVYVAVGDLNQDSRINASDVRLMSGILSGSSSTALAMESADCNLDGRVNARDQLALKMKVAGSYSFTN